jgi:hypothetical protein
MIRRIKTRGRKKIVVIYFIVFPILVGDSLSKRAVDMTFQALYTLTDLRVILRETAPRHVLDETRRIQAQRLLENLERQVASLKQEMLK